jgi:hypothetical protein
MMQAYEKIANKRKGNGKAIVMVARKLLVSIYWVLVRDELYHGFIEDVFSRKLKKL